MSKLKLLLKTYFQSCIEAFRHKEGLTQESMAEKLFISTRSYIDLEHGKSCCSSLTLMFFLGSLSDEECLSLYMILKKNYRKEYE
ncbi:XRE family transcriptional regulator [Lachnospiraceae bacterium OF09-33XD]|nr:XRE family transcriptional regulator [Lachnospiraceae bacterium OF09-33XD]